MATAIPDLWPPDIKTEVLTPLAIMRYQAGQLRQKTNNLLEAEVATETKNKHVWLNLDIIAPALNRYRHRLLVAVHSVNQVYPVHLELGTGSSRQTAANQDAFMDLLAKSLKADRVISVLHSLIAQSNEVASSSK